MSTLPAYRKKIDEIDKKLLELFSKRITYAKLIGEYKKEKKLPIRDKKRELEIITTLVGAGKIYNISPKLIKKIWKSLFEESYKVEK